MTAEIRDQISRVSSGGTLGNNSYSIIDGIQNEKLGEEFLGRTLKKIQGRTLSGIFPGIYGLLC